jgi:prepilin-type N-terminal cleavage/methylation domain-containing protein
MPETPRQSRGNRLDGGFTLIELILVMLVLTIIVGTAMPKLAGFLPWARSRDTVAKLVAIAQYARSKAATDAKVYRLAVDGSSCWLEVQEGESFQRVTDELAEPVEVPDGGSITIVPGANNASTSNTSVTPLAPTDGVIFNPDGSTSHSFLRYTAPDGHPTLLGSPSPTETFRALAPEEAQRL